MDKLTEEKIADGRIEIISTLEFNFESSSNNGEYHSVDLSKYEGSGECFCEHFRFRILPKLKSGEIKPYEKGSQCKHILLARHILGDRLIKISIKDLDKKKVNFNEKKKAS